MKTSSESTVADSGTPPLGEKLAEENNSVIRPPNKLDDKVAALEDSLLGTRASFNRERFIYIVSIGILFDILVGCMAPFYVFLFAVILTVAIFIGLAHWLDFPWVITYLERIFKIAEDRLRGKTPEAETEIEPLTLPSASRNTNDTVPASSQSNDLIKPTVDI